MSDTLLKERDAVQRTVCLIDTREQQDEDSGRADQKRIDVYRNDLGQTLFCRVGNFSGRRSVGGRTHTGFVGEQAAFDAVYHAGAGEASEDRLEVKS